jgi:hypothetical protein
LNRAKSSRLKGSCAKQVYGGLRQFLRDEHPLTPPGPEGSNGTGHVVCRRGAGAGRRQCSEAARQSANWPLVSWLDLRVRCFK